MKQYIKDFLFRQVSKRLCYLVRCTMLANFLSVDEFISKIDNIGTGELLLHVGQNHSIAIYSYKKGEIYGIYYRPLYSKRVARHLGSFQRTGDDGEFGTFPQGEAITRLLMDLFLLMTL